MADEAESADVEIPLEGPLEGPLEVDVEVDVEEPLEVDVEEPVESRKFFGPGAQPGEIIAERYRVLGELGAGGMGQVVEVEHLELEKPFALKLIRPDRWDAVLEARFRREAKALARVSSPRVAQITDFGVDPDRGPFYVMELANGQALDDLIQRQGALSTERALAIAIGIAEALVDVHEAGIVHRDIKPGNIAVTGQQPIGVRLMDFGLASSVDDRFGSRMTESRRVVGSMPYMAPEQFHGEHPTPAMDLWALGIVLYEMLSGKLPYNAPSTAALIHRILTESVPFGDPRPRECAIPLEHLLAKDPDARCPTAREAVVLLRAAAATPHARRDPPHESNETAEATKIETDPPPPAPPLRVTPRPPGPRVEPRAVAPPRPAGWMVATAVLLVTLVALASWAFGRFTGEEAATGSVPQLEETVDDADEETATAAPDPESVADPVPELVQEPPPIPIPVAIPTPILTPTPAARSERGRPTGPRPTPAAPAVESRPQPSDDEPPEWTGALIESRSP